MGFVYVEGLTNEGKCVCMCVFSYPKKTLATLFNLSPDKKTPLIKMACLCPVALIALCN